MDSALGAPYQGDGIGKSLQAMFCCCFVLLEATLGGRIVLQPQGAKCFCRHHVVLAVLPRCWSGRSLTLLGCQQRRQLPIVRPCLL